MTEEVNLMGNNANRLAQYPESQRISELKMQFNEDEVGGVNAGQLNRKNYSEHQSFFTKNKNN